MGMTTNNDKPKAKPVTVQFEMVIARRGALTTTVKERRFPSEAALQRWADKHAGNVTILRYLSENSY